MEVPVYLPLAKGLGAARRDRSDSGGLCLLTTNPSPSEHYEKYTVDGETVWGICTMWGSVDYGIFMEKMVGIQG